MNFESFEIGTMQPQNIIEYYFVQHRNIVKKRIVGLHDCVSLITRNTNCKDYVKSKCICQRRSDHEYQLT